MYEFCTHFLRTSELETAPHPVQFKLSSKPEKSWFSWLENGHLICEFIHKTVKLAVLVPITLSFIGATMLTSEMEAKTENRIPAPTSSSQADYDSESS